MKNQRKSSLLLGSIIIFFIAATPYMLYMSQSIDPEIENLDTIFGVIKGGYYLTAQNFIYWFSTKFVPLLLLIIWFLTNKHWWAHALIIPISVYLFQLIAVCNDSIDYIDEVEFIYTVPIATIVMVILYYLRSNISIYIQAIDLKTEMDEIMKTTDESGDDQKVNEQ